MGEFPWRFLALRNERLSRLRLGYFDADDKCDVLTESRFDLSQRDHRPGATRQTTRAFWRKPDGEWLVVGLLPYYRAGS